jgi:hypothetical protein
MRFRTLRGPGQWRAKWGTGCILRFVSLRPRAGVAAPPGWPPWRTYQRSRPYIDPSGSGPLGRSLLGVRPAAPAQARQPAGRMGHRRSRTARSKEQTECGRPAHAGPPGDSRWASSRAGRRSPARGFAVLFAVLGLSSARGRAQGENRPGRGEVPLRRPDSSNLHYRPARQRPAPAQDKGTLTADAGNLAFGRHSHQTGPKRPRVA